MLESQKRTNFLLGKDIPYTRCKESLEASPFQYAEEFFQTANFWTFPARMRSERIVSGFHRTGVWDVGATA